MKGRTKCQEKIAVITARADDRTQKDIICGIAEAVFAADTDVVVFSNIYNHWIRDEFLNFENVIYNRYECLCSSNAVRIYRREIFCPSVPPDYGVLADTIS